MMRRSWACILAVLLALVWTGVASAQGLQSDQVPDPLTMFIGLRDAMYQQYNSMRVQGLQPTLAFRVTYARVVIMSYLLGLEDFVTYSARLADIAYPSGVQLTFNAYRFQMVVTWLQRGEIQPRAAEEQLGQLEAELAGR